MFPCTCTDLVCTRHAPTYRHCACVPDGTFGLARRPLHAYYSFEDFCCHMHSVPAGTREDTYRGMVSYPLVTVGAWPTAGQHCVRYA